MASIINSISFKNFFNYFGDYNDCRYEFTEGVNIVIADNGAGKSKFFNAFLWLFYDQVLDSDDKIKKNVENFAFKIISDKAKNQALIGEVVETGIKIEYSTKRYKFQIIKSFSATKINEKIFEPTGWQIVMNDIEVAQTEHIVPKYKPVYNSDEKTSIINRLILQSLRQYSFFQGEEVDQMIDFNKKSSIEDAVRTLTNISKYEDISLIVAEIADKAERELNKIEKQNGEHSGRLETAIKTKGDFETKIKGVREKLKEYQNVYSIANEEVSNLEQNFGNAQKRKEIDDNIATLNKDFKALKEEYDSFLDSINDKFFDGNYSWISLGFESYVKDFKEKISSFRQKRYEKKALTEAKNNPNDYFTILPKDSPDAITLQQMIDAEHCYVCDRPAKEGTKEHKYLLKLKERPIKSSNETDFVKNNLDDFFGDLQLNAAPFLNKFDSIIESTKRVREKEITLKNRLDKVSAKLKVLKSDRKNILISGNESDGNENAETIIRGYKAALRRVEDADYKISYYTTQIEDLNTELTKIIKEIGSLRPKNTPQGYIDNYNISRDLAEATIKAKDRVFDKMINLLEEHANNHFKNLIKYNSIEGGILKFNKTPSGAISLNYLDKKGNEVSGASEGFQRMKKFAVIMSIISANTSQYNYPLLADAPLSAFGKAFNKGFFEAIPGVFPQSIILVKDLYDKDSENKLTDLGQELLNSNLIKTFYINEVDKNLPQIERTTKIEKRK